MQFSVIGQWLIDGQSPNTGKPVLETRRIVKPGQKHFHESAINIEGYPKLRETSVVYVGDFDRFAFEIGQTYAIQLGRGKKAIGRTNKLASIQRQDVREMTLQQAIDSGFKGTPEYLMVWTKMHDPVAYNHAQCDLMAHEYERRDQFDSWVHIEAANWFRYLQSRPAERYDAWVLRFEAAGMTLQNSKRRNPMTEVKTVNQRIAEILGWTDIEPYHFWQESNDGAYERDWFRGTTPDGSTDTMLPDYEHDLNVAWSLVGNIEGAGLAYAPDPEYPNTPYWGSLPRYGDLDYFTVPGETPALALCSVWREWTTWKQSLGVE